MTQNAIKTELLLLDRGGEWGSRRKGFRRGAGGGEGGEELAIGTDEKQNFKNPPPTLSCSLKTAASGELVCIICECVCASARLGMLGVHMGVQYIFVHACLLIFRGRKKSVCLCKSGTNKFL